MQNGNFTVTGYNPAMAHNVTGKTLAEDYILFQNLALPSGNLSFLPANGTCSSSVQSSNITLAFQCAGSNSGTGSCCYDTNAAQYQV